MSKDALFDAGFGKADITPPLSFGPPGWAPILGFWWERAKPYREIHDPLMARALALRDGRQTAVIVSCDTLGDRIGFGDRAASRIERGLGIPASRVLIASTHTHTAPETIGLCGRPIDPRWTDQLVEGIVSAAAQAVADLSPARLLFHRGRTEGISMNRRADGVRQRQADCQASFSPEEFARLCWHDPRIQVLAIEGESGVLRGVVVHFACHPIIMQTAPMISADFPGAAMAFLEKRLGTRSVCLFLNGACGDINPCCKDTRNYADVISVARRVAIAASQAMARPGPSEVRGTLAAARTEIALARRATAPAQHLEAQIDALRRQQANTNWNGPPENQPLGRQIYELQEQLEVARMTETLQAIVQVIRIGNLHLVGLSGELFACLGRDVQNALPGPAFAIGYANRYLGYLSPREAYRLEGYEARMARWCPLAEGAGEAVRDAAVGLARSLI